MAPKPQECVGSYGKPPTKLGVIHLDVDRTGRAMQLPKKQLCLALIFAILLGACANDNNSSPVASEPVTTGEVNPTNLPDQPTVTAEDATVQALSTTTMTTTTTIPLTPAACPEGSEGEGIEYRYDPSVPEDQERARLDTCGPIWEEGECPADYEAGGQSFRWSSDLGSREEVIAENCGAKLVSAVCPEGSEGEGIEYRYDPSVPEDQERARLDTCGPIWEEGECPADYEAGGQSFRWSSDLGSREEVIAENCGAKLVSAVCPEGSENADKRYMYDPSGTRNQARVRLQVCGLIWQVDECPDNYEMAGTQFRWPHRLDYSSDLDEARTEHCGTEYKVGDWSKSSWGTELDNYSGSAVSLEAYRAEKMDPEDAVPILRIVCHDDTLAVLINWGGAHVEGLPSTAGFRTDKVHVGYRFGDDNPVEKFWIANNSERVFLERADRGAFVKSLRSTENGILVVDAVGGPHGDRIGTAWFDLTGITLSVEPIVQECGW